MKFAVAALLAALLMAAGSAAAQKGKKKKERGAPDLAVTRLKIQREGDHIVLEGKIKNVSLKSLRGMVLFFEFLEFDGKMISRMTTGVSEDDVPPGEEGEFTTQTPDQVRAVSVRLDGEDGRGQYLVLDKPGPYTIE